MISFDTEAIESIIEGSPKKNGSYNLFFPINETIAVKASISESIKNNYERQKNASEYGLGPDTYGLVEFNYLDKKWYGYLTEIVETFDDSYEFEKSGYYSSLFELIDELKNKTGFHFRDNHFGNVGIKNGKLVCIDFDNIGSSFPEPICSIVQNVSQVV